MPQIFFTEVRPQEGGPDRQKDHVGSPVDRLVDTVARMQVDLADLRAENRMLRTPRVPLDGVRAPRQAAFTTTKVPRFDGTLVGNNINRFSTREFEWLGQ